MATIEESAVFEYYNNIFNELKKQDGGYYPHKHDPIALRQTAEHFSIAESEASRIYDEYKKHAADVEMAVVKKMPKAAREKFFRQRSHDILCNNRDLPFYRFEGEPSSELKDPSEILSDEYQAFIARIASVGWSIPTSIDIRRFQQLEKQAADKNTINGFFTSYYDKRELRLLWRRVEKTLQEGVQKELFMQCKDAYERGNYLICRQSLISVLEGMISSFNPDPKDVHVMHVCDEQANMNGHWIEHGRTNHLDNDGNCLQLFNAISTICNIRQYDT